MQVNQTPHLDKLDDIELKTGGSLKDGLSYLMPQDEMFLYNEVTCSCADELDEHVKEQTLALKNMYLATTVVESSVYITSFWIVAPSMFKSINLCFKIRKE